MAEISDFSADELRTMQLAPVMVIGAAAASEPGGTWSVVKEMAKGVASLSKVMGPDGPPLIKQILESTEKDDTLSDETPSDFKDPEERQKLLDSSIETAVAAQKLLIDKADSRDADAYSSALINAAQSAVEASKTGSFLGFGGERVTDSEVAYVQRLADALGFKKTS